MNSVKVAFITIILTLATNFSQPAAARQENRWGWGLVDYIGITHEKHAGFEASILASPWDPFELYPYLITSPFFGFNIGKPDFQGSVRYFEMSAVLPLGRMSTVGGVGCFLTVSNGKRFGNEFSDGRQTTVSLTPVLFVPLFQLYSRFVHEDNSFRRDYGIMMKWSLGYPVVRALSRGL